MNELFPVESVTQDSPKLAWLKKHGIMTHYEASLEGGGESPETGDDYYPWVCGKDKNGFVYETGCGHSEEEAIVNYCEKTGTPHYSLAQ